MHILHKVLSERNEEKYAEHTAEQRAKEYFKKVYCYFRVCGLKYVEGGEGEYCAGHYHAGTRSDRLYDYVLPKGILFLEIARKAHGNDCYRYCGFKYLSDF